jgi:hypothetical protein
MTNVEAIEILKKEFGSLRAVALRLGVTEQALREWPDSENDRVYYYLNLAAKHPEELAEMTRL